VSAEPPATKPSRYVVIAQLKLGSITALNALIRQLGTSCAIAESAWLLASTHSMAALRNLLLPGLRSGDQLFIVDMGRDKATWTNYGPADEARFRQMWAAGS
jgi:hypothetical protein